MNLIIAGICLIGNMIWGCILIAIAMVVWACAYDAWGWLGALIAVCIVIGVLTDNNNNGE